MTKSQTKAVTDAGKAPRVMSPVGVCNVKSERLSDGSEVWNVEFQSSTVACRSEKEAIFLNHQIKDLIANCSAWVSSY